eukprot:gene1079-1877_t
MAVQAETVNPFLMDEIRATLSFDMELDDCRTRFRVPATYQTILNTLSVHAGDCLKDYELGKNAKFRVTKIQCQDDGENEIIANEAAYTSFLNAFAGKAKPHLLVQMEITVATAVQRGIKSTNLMQNPDGYDKLISKNALSRHRLNGSLSKNIGELLVEEKEAEKIVRKRS